MADGPGVPKPKDEDTRAAAGPFEVLAFDTPGTSPIDRQIDELLRIKQSLPSANAQRALQGQLEKRPTDWEDLEAGGVRFRRERHRQRPNIEVYEGDSFKRVESSAVRGVIKALLRALETKQRALDTAVRQREVMRQAADAAEAQLASRVVATVRLDVDTD